MLRQHPSNGTYKAALGWAFFADASYDRAQAVETAWKLIEEAAKLSPRDANIHYYAGRIHKEKGEAMDVGWGSQIRSYVLAPYTMVKDHRTDHEMGDTTRVLDGDLDGFVRAYLLQAASSS